MNGGASWKPARTGLTTWQPFRLAVDPAHPDTVYAALQSNGLHRSIDGGAHWLPYDEGLPASAIVNDLVIDRNTGVLTAGVWEHGVFIRPAGASLWTALNKGLTGNDVGALIQKSDPSRLIAGIQSYGLAVFITTNDGQTWTASTSGINYRRVLSLAADPENPDILYSGNAGSAYTSFDGGTTWTDSGSGLPVGSVSLHALLARRGGPGVLIGGTYDGIWRAEGGEWKRAALEGKTILALVEDPASPAVIYAGLDPGGVYKSTNGGSSWKAAAKGLPAGATVLSLAAGGSNGKTIFAGLKGGGAYRSSDGGATWVKSGAGPGNGIIHSLLAVSGATRTILAGSVGGVYKSTDNGRTWARVGTGLPSDAVVDALVYDGAKHLLYCGGSNGVYSVAY